MRRLCSVFLSLALSLSLVCLPSAALEPQELRDLLEELYVEDVPQSVLEQDTVQGILDALGDPYTVYMSHEEYQAFLDSVNGEELCGIGASIENGPVEDGLLILSTLPNSPALQAGLEAGDRILEVDGVTITSIDQISLLTGEAGTPVTIRVRRNSGAVEEITLVRQVVQVPIVTTTLEDGVVVIDCTSFGASTSEDIRQALTDYADLDTAWILDLRANPGGTTDAAAGSAGWFAGSSIMVYFLDGQGRYSYIYTLPSTPDLTDKPLIILTSPYSASASELFSAAIRDLDCGISVGQRTFGKGIAQMALDEENYPEIFDGDCLKMTIYRFYSPNGLTNQTVGVLPTLLISPDYTQQAAMLLTSGAPQQAKGFLKLELCGQTLYIDLEKAMESREAFVELLEALPPACTLYQGSGTEQWDVVTPAQAAGNLGLSEYTPRTFSDTEDTPYQEAVDTLAVYQLISGYEDGTFRPESSITRAEFCAMLANTLNLSEGTDAPFTDVGNDDWFASPVAAVAKQGFISGYGDGTFRPDAPITAQEIVSILAQAASWLSMDGQNLDSKTYESADYPGFEPWAVHSAGVFLSLTGSDMGLCAPDQDATRGAAAQMIYDLLENIGFLWDRA